MAKNDVPTGWVGWVYFASVMLLIAGGLQIINGLAGIFHESFYVVTQKSLLAFNFTTWGWVHLLLGILILLTGVGVWGGNKLAQVAAVFLSALLILVNIAFLSAYPLWAIIAITINGFVIYALTLHGDEVKQR